jgi:hypothetical protein
VAVIAPEYFDNGEISLESGKRLPHNFKAHAKGP